MTSTEKRRWRRWAIAAAVVGVVLAIGKAIPTPGLDTWVLSELIAVCSGNYINWHLTWGVQCLLPKPMHLASAEHVWMWGGALVLFVFLWVRLRLTAAMTAAKLRQDFDED